MKVPDRFRTRHVVALVFLGLQVLSITYARFVPERFFCWAPYDERAQYRIDVELNGRLLAESEVAQRYRYNPSGWEPRSVHNVISMVRQYERTYGKTDGAHIAIHYRINGAPEQTWTWPSHNAR